MNRINVQSARDVPAANTEALATIAAPGEAHRWRVASVGGGYTEAPTGGLLEVVENAGGGDETVLWSVPVGDAGPVHLRFDPPLQAGPGKSVSARVAAGGGTVVGHANIAAHLDQ